MSVTKKQMKKKVNFVWPLMIAGTAVVLSLAVILILLNFDGNKDDRTADNGTTVSSGAQNTAAENLIAPIGGVDGALNEAGDLEILVADLKTTVSLYNFDPNGITEQIIALNNSAGEPKLAFNTCQVCKGSPYAYFVETGNTLQCQNCGNVFSTDVVGKTSGGCNPIPITEANAKVEGGKVVISKEFLTGQKNLFANWKKA